MFFIHRPKTQKTCSAAAGQYLCNYVSNKPWVVDDVSPMNISTEQRRRRRHVCINKAKKRTTSTFMMIYGPSAIAQYKKYHQGWLLLTKGRTPLKLRFFWRQITQLGILQKPIESTPGEFCGSLLGYYKSNYFHYKLLRPQKRIE